MNMMETIFTSVISSGMVVVTFSLVKQFVGYVKRMWLNHVDLPNTPDKHGITYTDDVSVTITLYDGNGGSIPNWVADVKTNVDNVVPASVWLLFNDGHNTNPIANFAVMECIDLTGKKSQPVYLRVAGETYTIRAWVAPRKKFPDQVAIRTNMGKFYVKNPTIIDKRKKK